MASLLELIQKKQKEVQAQRGRMKTEKFPAGQSRWRIMKHWSGNADMLPTVDFGQHFVKDFSGEVQAVYLCTAKTYSKECPVCDTIRSAVTKVMDPNAKQLIEGAKSAQRYLVNAVRHNGKGYEKEAVILELPSTVFDTVMGIAAQYLADGIDIFSLEAGHDIVVTKNGTGTNTKYQVVAAPKSTVLDGKYMEQAKNLDDYVAQEHEAGKAKILAALANLSGSTTPALPGAKHVPLPVAGALPAGTVPTKGVATVDATPKDADLEDSLADVDLSDIALEDLEQVAS